MPKTRIALRAGRESCHLVTSTVAVVHRELPNAEYGPHYKKCPGLSTPCAEACPPTGEPVDQLRPTPN